MRYHFILFLLVLYLAAPLTAFSSPQKLPSSYQIAPKTTQATVFIFTSRFCASCQNIAPHLPKLKKRYASKARFKEYLLETPHGEKAFQTFKQNAVPAILVYSPQHQLKTELSDDMTPAQLTQFLKQALR